MPTWTALKAVALSEFPFGCAAEAVSIAEDGTVTLFWNPSPGAASYTVYRTEVEFARFEPIAANLATTALADSQYVDAKVDAGRQYFYRVAATKPGETSPLSFPAGAVPVDNSNLDFESPVLPAKAQMANPPGADWKFEGRAGLIAFDSPRVARHQALQGRQAAYLTGSGRLSQDLVFPADRHFLRFRTTQIQGRASFRVLVDGRQVGI